jgi:putative glutamine amidotransferase
MELTLLREALAADLPVLAICRGLQLLNVWQGGSLLQHIEGHAGEEGLSAWHDVTVEAGSQLHGVLGSARARVNSRHHQAVTPDRLGRGLRITAMSNDNLVEGVESTEQRWLIGVQWHPERLENQENFFNLSSKRLFEALASALVVRRV